MSHSIPTVRRTVSNLVAIWANRILAIVAMLITTPLILHRFGMEVTGVWLMITIFVSHLSLLDSGLGNIVVRFLAAQKATNDPAKGSGYLATTFYLLMVIGLMLLASSPLLVFFFMQSLQLGSNEIAGARESVWIAIIFVAISLPLRVGNGLLSSIHRMDMLNMMLSLSIAVRIMLIICVFSFLEPSLMDLALIVFASTLLGTLLVFVSGVRNNRELSVRLSDFSLTAMKDLFSLGGSALVVTLSALLLTQSSPMLTGFVLGPDFVPIVAYPLMIFSALTPFMASLQTLLTPVVSGLSATQGNQRILPIFQMAVRYQSAAAIFLLLGFFMFGEILISTWLSGPKINSETLTTIGTSVVILFAGFAFSSVAFIGRSVLTSVGRHWPSAVIEFGTALGGLVLGYALLRYSSFGVYGITVGVAFTLVIRGLLFYPYLLGKFFQISPVKLIFDGLALNFLLAMISVFLFILFYIALHGLQQISSQLWLILAKISSLLVWCLLNWLYLIETKHKNIIKNRAALYWSQLSLMSFRKIW